MDTEFGEFGLILGTSGQQSWHYSCGGRCLHGHIVYVIHLSNKQIHTEYQLPPRHQIGHLIKHKLITILSFKKLESVQKEITI